MIKTILMTLVFLLAADIVMYDGKYSDTAGRVAQGVYHQFAGR